MGSTIGGGTGGFSSCDESPPNGDCVARILPLKSLEPLDRDRERERRFLVTLGDIGRSSSSVSASTSFSAVFSAAGGG